MTQYGDIDLGEHWLRLTWGAKDLNSNTSLKNTLVNLASYISGVNESIIEGNYLVRKLWWSENRSVKETPVPQAIRAMKWDYITINRDGLEFYIYILDATLSLSSIYSDSFPSLLGPRRPILRVLVIHLFQQRWLKTSQ